MVQDELSIVSTAAATRMSPPPAKLPWQVDVTIIGWIHKAIIGATVMQRIVVCIHRITHRITDGWHAAVLIMPLGWMAASGGLHCSQRYKAKWTYWVVRQRRDGSRCHCAGRTSVNNNNNNNNTNDNVYGAVIMTQSLREFTRFIWRTQTSARRPPTLRPGQPTWAASLPVGCYMAYIHHRHFIITQLESWYSFYRPTDGGRLSQPRNTACSPIQCYYIVLHCTWVWETCPRFLHGSDLAGNRTSYLWYASPMLYQ